MTWWPAMALVLVLAGRLWVRLPLRWGRAAGWGVLLISLVAVHLALHHAGAVVRMVAFCSVLLAGMKAIVYREWVRPGWRELGLRAYLGFGLGWFGMDPGAFARKGESIEWKSHLRIGLACMCAGTLSALVVRSMGWTALVLVFVPMSIGFHYGALRVLTAGWRAAGFPVRVLFRNPLAATGLADFWSRRWNLGYSQMMVRVVKRPMEGVVGRRPAEWMVFVASGLLHEVAITVPVGAGYGLPTAYFLIQAIGVQVERAEWPGGWRRAWAAILVVAPLGLLFPPAFHHEVILPCLRVLPDPGSLSILN